MSDALVALPPMSRDIRMAAWDLGDAEARYLVDTYYQMQEFRKATNNQLRSQRAAEEEEAQPVEEPHETLDFVAKQFDTVESQIRGALDQYSAKHPIGSEARKVVGVGPVIAAGLVAHIDFKVESVGRIWRFAGLDPTSKWGKGQKRPWNADLKVLCWKIGDSFVKQSGREDCFYGHKYKERKQYEIDRNEAVEEVSGEGFYDLDNSGVKKKAVQIGEKWFVGGNSEAALETLTTRNVQDKQLKATLLQGKIPPGRLDLRARRWAVKLFLSHLYEVGHKIQTGEDAPLPYPIANPMMGEHTQVIERPWE